MKYAIVDIETTGSRAGQDKITEIAIILTDGKTVLDEFSTLINPEKRIPPFITRLTGIDNQLTDDAPKFYEVAKDIQLFTKDSVFVAHNVRFDYGFLKSEFQDLGGTFSRKTLCTVRLARKLIPGLPSYSLGKLCESIDIPIENRHRAMGDAKATQLLFHKLMNIDESKEHTKWIHQEVLKTNFPPELDESQILSVPCRPGIYSFYDKDNRLLYIGKSINLNKRVLEHFQIQSKTHLEKDFKNKICHFNFEETGNELMALLLEAKAIKDNKPLYNKALRRRYYRFGIFLEKQNEISKLCIHSLHNHENPLLEFGTRQAAQKFLEKACEKFKIDKACTNLDALQTQMTDHPLLHEQKIKAFKQKHSYPYENFVLLGDAMQNDLMSVVLVEDGQLVAWGFVESAQSFFHVNDLKPHLQKIEETRDYKRIILSIFQNLKKRKPYRLIKNKEFFSDIIL